MKPFLLFFIALLIMGSVYAQKSPVTEQLTAKLITDFNTQKTESLYTLFADEVKPQLSLTKLGQVVQQFKNGYGDLGKSEYAGAQNGDNIYMIDFEKPGVALYVAFNKNNKITRFFIGAGKEAAGSVTIKTPSAVIKGTLSVPQTNTPVPVVILIAGSGPTDRDGNDVSLKSNNLLMISDALKLKNIAVLRYDKSTVSPSTINKPITDITFDDEVDDAAAIIKMLKTDKRFSKVIVAGHSEGSLIGMLAGERENADAFISLAGAGLPADEILKTQLKSLVPATDYPKVVSIIDSIKAGNFTKQKMGPGFDTLFDPALQPYLYSWMKYDPQQAASKLTIPVLIVQGTNDIQVSVDNAELLKKADPDAQLKLIPGMSHVLKEGPADSMQNFATYNNPDLPLHPQLIPTLTAFIDGLK